ncbi:MAG: [acyl-carrier-protein] S-malonyltransferase [Bacteroidota bacterium]
MVNIIPQVHQIVSKSELLKIKVFKTSLCHAPLLRYFYHKKKTMRAYVFPGQGSQFSGMGKDIYEQSTVAKTMMDQANSILGFELTKVMFEGTEEELKQTKITQPAIFLHSVSLAAALGTSFQPQMVAGHSLGEISALVANKTLSFESGLTLVYKRAMAMQRACELNPSTMAAILGMEDAKVEEICAGIAGVVVAANYNCPGQLVISGENQAVDEACAALSAAGAKRALRLPVGGAFHSPLMEPAREELAEAIANTTFEIPICPVYQNVTARPTTDPQEIKSLLIQQLTAPVRWTQTMEAMLADGCAEVIEVGPGKVLQGLFKKVNRDLVTSSAELVMN